MRSNLLSFILLTLYSGETLGFDCKNFVAEDPIQTLFDQAIRPQGSRPVDSKREEVNKFYQAIRFSDSNHVQIIFKSISSMDQPGVVWLNLKRAAFELIDRGQLDKGFVSSLYAHLLSGVFGQYMPESREHNLIIQIYDSYLRGHSPQSLKLPPSIGIQMTRLFHPDRAAILSNPYFSINQNNLFILRDTRIWEVTSERTAKLWWEALVQFKNGNLSKAKQVLASQFSFLAERESLILEHLTQSSTTLQPSFAVQDSTNFNSLYVSNGHKVIAREHLLRIELWHERTVKSWAALAMDVPEVFSVMNRSDFAEYLY